MIIALFEDHAKLRHTTTVLVYDMKTSKYWIATRLHHYMSSLVQQYEEVDAVVYHTVDSKPMLFRNPFHTEGPSYINFGFFLMFIFPSNSRQPLILQPSPKSSTSTCSVLNIVLLLLSLFHWLQLDCLQLYLHVMTLLTMLLTPTTLHASIVRHRLTCAHGTNEVNSRRDCTEVSELSF